MLGGEGADFGPPRLQRGPALGRNLGFVARPGAVFLRFGDDQPASPVRGVGAQRLGEKHRFVLQPA